MVPTVGGDAYAACCHFTRPRGTQGPSRAGDKARQPQRWRSARVCPCLAVSPLRVPPEPSGTQLAEGRKHENATQRLQLGPLVMPGSRSWGRGVRMVTDAVRRPHAMAQAECRTQPCRSRMPITHAAGAIARCSGNHDRTATWAAVLMPCPREQPIVGSRPQRYPQSHSGRVGKVDKMEHHWQGCCS